MTADIRTDDLSSAIYRASRLHHRLVWIAGGTAVERTTLLNNLAKTQDGVCIEVGKCLSAALIDVPAPLRTVSVEECFQACFEKKTDSAICLNHLEILFEPTLQINPVALVKSASRHTLIVAAWPGDVHDGHLTFGTPDHSSFMELSEQDLEAIVYFI